MNGLALPKRDGRERIRSLAVAASANVAVVLRHTMQIGAEVVLRVAVLYFPGRLSALNRPTYLWTIVILSMYSHSRRESYNQSSWTCTYTSIRAEHVSPNHEIFVHKSRAGSIVQNVTRVSSCRHMPPPICPA
jgi:hypothetical protein